MEGIASPFDGSLFRPGDRIRGPFISLDPSMERQYRLRRPLDFERVRREGQSWVHPLVVLAAARNGRSVSRFGFVTSKRVGNAVQRNRARRLMRESVRRQLAHIPPGWDCVFVARAPLVEATFAEVDAAVTQLLERAQLWQAAEA